MWFALRLTLVLLAVITALAGLWVAGHRHTPAPALLAYLSARDSTGVYVAWPGGPAPRRLAGPDGLRENVNSLAWSPVCFQTWRGCRVALLVEGRSTNAYTIRLNGSGRSPSLAPGGAVALAWSPDGRWLAINGGAGNTTDIFLSQPDGSDLHNLTDHPAYEFGPVWSPDGTRLAFTSYRGDEAVNQGKIYIAAPDSAGRVTALIQVTGGDTVERALMWSPDGTRLYFSSSLPADPASVPNLFVAQVDVPAGTPLEAISIRQITDAPGGIGSPALSPDGQWIAFELVRDGSPDIYAIRPDGSGLRNLSRRAQPDLLPVWSPDGQWVAFRGDRSPRSDIFLAQPGAAARRNLTDYPAVDYNPVWSPDGQWIAFESLRDGNREIYVIRPDGSGLANVSQYAGVDSQPVWSPPVALPLRPGVLWIAAALLIGAAAIRRRRASGSSTASAQTGGGR